MSSVLVLSLSICIFMFISSVSTNLYIYEWLWWWWCLATKLCPTLYDPMDCRLPGSSVHGIFQARILDGGHFLLWGISQPRDWTHAYFMGRQILYHWAIREAPIYLWIYLSIHLSIDRLLNWLRFMLPAWQGFCEAPSPSMRDSVRLPAPPWGTLWGSQHGRDSARLPAPLWGTLWDTPGLFLEHVHPW